MGTITLNASQNGQNADLSQYEFGLTKTIHEKPTKAQVSSEFKNLSDGTYVVWWRIIGDNWTDQNTLIESISCLNTVVNLSFLKTKITVNFDAQNRWTVPVLGTCHIFDMYVNNVIWIEGVDFEVLRRAPQEIEIAQIQTDYSLTTADVVYLRYSNQ